MKAKKAFTLVEVLIVVGILGILAAVVLPEFQNHTQKARESAAKDTLRIMRNVIGLYAAKHNDVPPGYLEDGASREACYWTYGILITQEGYVHKMPVNPFNGLIETYMVLNNEPFPTEATGQYGWIYKPATQEYRIDWPGTDSEGIRYFDY